MYTYVYQKNSKQMRASKIAFNHLSDIDIKYYQLCKKCTEKPQSFLVILFF